MRPLLAHIYEPHRVTFPCYVQPKLNGIRALYQNGRFQSRDEVPFPDRLLQHLAEPLRDLFDPQIVLDGELYVHGWPLQRINAAVTPVRQEPTEDTRLVKYHVFDRVDYGSNFRIRHFAQMNLGGSRLAIKSGIRWVETCLVKNQTEADELYAKFVSQGYEGMMYRLGNCPYTLPKQSKLVDQGKGFLSDKDNRVWHLLKRKDWQDDEFLITGIVEGEGKYEGTLGSFEYGKKDGTPLRDPSRGGKPPTVGSGITDAQRDHYFANPPIGKLIKVKYLVLSNDGIPLNPTILAIL